MFIAALGFYFLIVLFVAVIIYKRGKKKGTEDSSDFWTGGGQISGNSLGLSISATMMSISWSVVYGSQLFYDYGFGGLWLLGIPWLITLAFFWRLAPWMRRQKIFSQPELLGKAFGPQFRIYSALLLSIVFLTWAAGEIFAAGNILGPLLEVDPVIAMAIISVMIALYSLLGGFSAVVSTDKIQFALVALFMVLIIYLGLQSLDMNISQVLILGSVESNSGILSPGISLIILTFFAYLPGWFVETDIWLRIQAAKNDKEARKGAAVALTNSIVFVIILPMFIGFMARAWQVEGSSDPVTSVLTAIILNPEVGVFWQLLLFLGLISAAMSTIDTNTNIVALSFGSDIIEANRKRLKWLKMTPIRIARIATLFSVVIAFIYATLTESLWDIFYLSSGLLTTTIAIPVFLALKMNKNRTAAWLASFIGLLFTILFFILERTGFFNSIYPEWLLTTQLGYLIWGLSGSLLGYMSGLYINRRSENR